MFTYFDPIEKHIVELINLINIYVFNTVLYFDSNSYLPHNQYFLRRRLLFLIRDVLSYIISNLLSDDDDESTEVLFLSKYAEPKLIRADAIFNEFDLNCLI